MNKTVVIRQLRGSERHGMPGILTVPELLRCEFVVVVVFETEREKEAQKAPASVTLGSLTLVRGGEQ